MELAARTGAWSGKALPYSKVLDFIESDGRQYISMGTIRPHIMSSDIMSYVTVTLRKLYTGDYEYAILGAYLNFLAFVSGKIKDGYAVRWSNPEIGVKERLQIRIKSENVPFFIFGFAESKTGTSNVFGIVNAAIHKIELIPGVNELIPVLDLNGRPAFYETMTNELYYNQGPGEFAWGELDETSNAPSQLGGRL